ncbi:MAG: Wzz/FepE/Etk N-terminal domain-containing protein [Pirellulaceae bacterium]|nr:Wzz/FepE/Etk N-terminal domain-containing protein [Pirellulaceae bacterium]
MAQDRISSSIRHRSGVLGLLWCHKLTIIATLLLGMLATATYLVVSDREYRSEAKLFVRAGGRALNLQSASTSENLTFADSQQREVYAVAELLQSRLIAEKVVDQFGKELILDAKKDEQEKNSLLSLSVVKDNIKAVLANLNDYNLNPFQKFSDRDEAIEEFEKHFKVLPTKTSSVMSMSFDFSDPQVAMDILEFLLKTAMDEHFRVHRTPGSQEFFASQANRLRETLNDLELQLRDLKNETGLASLEIQRSTTLELIGKLEQDHVMSSTQLDEAEAEFESRRQQLGGIEKEIVTERATDQPNSIGQNLRSKVYDLEAEELNQASKLAADHPTLVSTRERLMEARKLLHDEKESVGVTTGVNPNHQATDLAVKDIEAKVNGLTKRVLSLSDKLRSARTEVQRLNAADVELSELQREIDLAQANYRTYSENLEQARINEELEHAKISGLTVLQAPTNSPTPISPIPLFALPLGFLLSCFAAAGFITLSEYRREEQSLVFHAPEAVPSTEVASTERAAPVEPTKVILQRVQRKSVIPR